MTSGPAARARARARRFRQVRGAVAGCVAAFGALVAHVAAGGSVELVPGLVVTAVALPMAVALTPGDAVGLPRIGATALVAQALGHLCLMMAPAGHPHAHDHHAGPAPSLAMLALHALVAIATVAVAAGLDRAALDVVRAAAGWLLPLLLALPVPVVGYRARVLVRVRRLRGRIAARVGRPRAPPRWCSALALPGAAR
ncbi:hypothetical protein ACFJIY_05420 [Pimelobacter simplex]|uniref:hypothetical protein n=1 Tax=Nocardioides simplex TaxID=2045 RepID=UPI0036721E23